MSEDLSSAGAEGGTQRELSVSRGHARGEQAADIPTGDHQDVLWSLDAVAQPMLMVRLKECQAITGIVC
jgi:hypothetical protein